MVRTCSNTSICFHLVLRQFNIDKHAFGLSEQLDTVYVVPVVPTLLCSGVTHFAVCVMKFLQNCFQLVSVDFSAADVIAVCVAAM